MTKKDKERIEFGKQFLEAAFPAHLFKWIKNSGICPFHLDSKPSINIFIGSRGKTRNLLMYFCFGCGASGSVTEAHSPERNLRQILASARTEDVIETTSYQTSWTRPWREMPEIAYYLQQRGVSPNVADVWQLRGAQTPKGSAVVFPNEMNGDEMDAYQLRYIIPNTFPKYWTSPGHSRIFKMATFQGCQILTLVEGCIDAVRVGPNTCPLLGKNLSPFQVQQLLSIFQGDDHPRELFICFDGGNREFLDQIRVLQSIGRRHLATIVSKCKLFVGELPAGKDPGDLGPDIFKYRIPIPLQNISGVLRLLDDSPRRTFKRYSPLERFAHRSAQAALR